MALAPLEQSYRQAVVSHYVGPGSLQEQWVFFTAELSLQPPFLS